MQVGERVGAVLGSNADGSLDFLGYGVYEGDLPYGDETPVGMVADAMRAMGRVTNPRLRLDNGDVVWGAECWWGDEEAVRAMLDGRVVHEVRIGDIRARVREEGRE